MKFQNKGSQWSTDEADPLGHKKDVSNEALTSCSTIDWMEGECWRTEDSYEKFDMDAHGRGPGMTDDKVCMIDDHQHRR